MIVPSTASSFSEAMRQGAEVYQRLKSLAKKKYGQSAGNVGDEGGVCFSYIPLSSNTLSCLGRS